MNGLHNALDAAGPQSAHIAGLWWFTLALCGVVFVLVLAAFAWALRRAPRADESTPARSEGPDSKRVRLTIAGAVGISAIGLFALLVASVTTDRALAHLPVQDALHVEVVAHQWWWDIHYDDKDVSKMFGTANELHIPVGRPVIVTLKSDDVIHSFWVPSLHGKKDLIPGRTSTIELRADRAGTYRGQCAEFCGLQHAFMAFLVVATPSDEFEQWADAQRATPPESSDAAVVRGKELFLSGSCMLCHAVQGTDAAARKAPDLTHVASRATLAAGTLANTPENMSRWIADPQAIKPGVNMPAHPLPQADLAALVAYMETLR
jgi:cytochrome c oxidase subunit 2